MLLKELTQIINEQKQTIRKEIVKKIIDGELDIYDILSHKEKEVKKDEVDYLQRLYDQKTEGGRYHADDDFEEIIDSVVDDLMADYKNGGFD